MTARKTRSTKIVAAAAVLTAGAYAQHVSDYTDHMRYEDRAASLAQTFNQSDEQDLDAALASLEIDPEETQAVVLAVETEDAETQDAETPDVATDIAPKTFEQAMLSFTDAEVEGMTMRIGAAITAREEFELDKKGAGHNIQKTLAKVRKALLFKNTSRVMLAAQIDPSFINRTLHDGSRYNVYAIDKVADAVKGIADGVVSNAINRACMVSLFQMKKAGQPFTGEVAKACASDKHHIEIALRKHLLRHTVSASTAPTQASSTMQALETLGIVKREGSSRAPVYHLVESPITSRLEEVLFQKAA